MATGNALALAPARSGGNALSTVLTSPRRISPTTRAPTLIRATHRPSVIASAAPMSISTVSSTELRRSRLASQQMAWQFFRGIGAAWYASMFKSNAISGLSIFPAEILKPRQEPTPVDDLYSLQQVVLDDLATGYSGPVHGYGPMLAALAIHDSVPGECFWYSTPDEETGANVHEILSTEELQSGPGGFQIRRLPADPPTPVVAGRDLLARMWTPDPVYKRLATSPMLVQQDTLEELWLLIQGGIAAAKSRLASANILTIPDELDYHGTVGPDGEPTEFEDELLTVGQTAIKNPRSPSRWFPVVLRGKSEFLKPEFLRTVELFKSMPKEYIDRINELRTRFAHDFDLPTELLTGLGDMTHWNAWIVDSMTWPHLRPIAERILANLTVSVYQPLLVAGGMDPREAARQVIWYDESLVVAKPDRSAAADVGVQNGSLSEKAWLRAHGFQEDDAPTDEEKARMFGWRWGDPGLAGTGDWQKASGRIATRITETAPTGGGPVDVVAPPGANPAPPETGPTPGPPSVEPALPVAASGNGHGNGHRKPLGIFATPPRVAVEGSTEPPSRLDHKRTKLRRLGTKLGRIDRDLLRSISVLADERLHALVKTAGNKLRSAAQGRPLVADSIRGLEPLAIPRQLGPSSAHSLGLNEQVMVDQAARSFAAKALPWIDQAQQATLSGIADATDQDYEDLDSATEPIRRDWLSMAEGILVAGFASQAQSFLYSPDPTDGPGEVSDVVAPRGAIRQALSVAGGADPGASGPTLGIGGGPMASDALGSGGAMVDGWQWVYTDLARTTFPGHLALDGIEFTSWDDPQLAVQPEDTWLGVEFYRIGDHDGCACDAEPVLIPVEDVAGEVATGELVGAEA